MSNMEIGEYIRTPKGVIGKVLEKSFFGNTRYLIKWDIAKAYYITKIKNIKHSKNIIDLIEVGDLIKYSSNNSGIDVIEVVSDVCSVDEDYKDGVGFVMTVLDDCIRSKDIKSIVTKEQFKEMEYRVDE